MAEPPYKRPRRDGEHDRPRFDDRSSRHSRNDRYDDRGSRGQGYRDRSPGRRQDRDYGGRDRHTDSGRRGGGDRGYDRDRRRDYHRDDHDLGHKSDRRGGRDDEHDRHRGRDERHTSRGVTRSRSPAKSPKKNISNDDRGQGEHPRVDRVRGFDRDIPIRKVATPPVAFRIERPASRDASHDRDVRSPAPEQAAQSEISGRRGGRPTAADLMDDGKNDDLDKRRDNGTDDDEDDDIVVEDDMMAQMQAMMGFGGFDTTKQKKIPGNNLGAVRKEKKTEYRQYMNRVGGFNRPLSPPRD